VPIVLKSGSLNFLEPFGPVQGERDDNEIQAYMRAEGVVKSRAASSRIFLCNYRVAITE